MVAKSFENLPVVSEVYVMNGRTYVDVKLRNGSIKRVRWYCQAEYDKMYSAKKTTGRTYVRKTEKEALGFATGYITIFKGNTYECKDWLKAEGANYKKWWGWSFPSDMKVPEELPEGIEAVQLNWELVGAADGSLYGDEVIKNALDSLLYEEDGTEFVGTIGERIEIDVVVEKTVIFQGYYGPSTLHSMRGVDGNVYTWTTASKTWEEGSEKTIRGTLKKHTTYKGTKQNVLTRCVEVGK